jgi:hypothetical protein
MDFALKPLAYNGFTSGVTVPTGGGASIGTAIVSVDFGTVPVSVKVEKRALTDGATHSDAWLFGRPIPITGEVYGASPGDMWDKVQEWLEAFSPQSPTIVGGFESSTVTTTYAANTLTDTFREVWHADILTKPTGIRYDPADPPNIKVIDGVTKCIYTVQQSDQTIIATSSAISGTYFLGMSGDPDDDTVFWLLDCPWKAGGALTGNKILKMSSADNSVLATYAIADGRWTDLKASDSFLWLTNWDTNKLHKFSKVGVEVVSYTISYQGVAQVDPTGLAIDGTSIIIAFNGTSRLLVTSTDSPTTVSRTYNTAGTGILGGEFDTTTHTELYFCSDSVGRIWKYTLLDVSATSTVVTDTVSIPLEPEVYLTFLQPTADTTTWASGYIPMRLRALPMKEPWYAPIDKKDAARGPHTMAVYAQLLASDPYKYLDCVTSYTGLTTPTALVETISQTATELGYRGDAPSRYPILTVAISAAGPADLVITINGSSDSYSAPTSLHIDCSAQTADVTIRWDRKAAYVNGDIVYGVIQDDSTFGPVSPGAYASYAVTGSPGGLTSVALSIPEAFF